MQQSNFCCFQQGGHKDDLPIVMTMSPLFCWLPCTACTVLDLVCQQSKHFGPFWHQLYCKQLSYSLKPQYSWQKAYFHSCRSANYGVTLDLGRLVGINEIRQSRNPCLGIHPIHCYNSHQCQSIATIATNAMATRILTLFYLARLKNAAWFLHCGLSLPLSMIECPICSNKFPILLNPFVETNYPDWHLHSVPSTFNQCLFLHGNFFLVESHLVSYASSVVFSLIFRWIYHLC